MGIKEEQKVLQDLDGLMYPNKQIRKQPTMTRSEYYDWEASLPKNKSKEAKSMNDNKKKETKVKKPTLSPSQRGKLAWKNHRQSMMKGVEKAKATMKAKAKNNPKKGK